MSFLALSCEREWNNPYDPDVEFPPPIDLTLTKISLTEIQLNWSDNSDFEDGFKIERKEGESEFKEIAMVESNITTLEDRILQEGINYTYRLNAFIGARKSNYSNEANYYNLFPPSNFQIEIVGEEAVLTWEDNSSVEDNYVIEQKVEPSGFSTIGIVDQNITTYKVSTSALNATNIYTFQIKNKQGVNYSEPSDSISIRFGGHELWTGDHADQVRSVAISPDGSKVTSGSWDETVKLWDASTGNLLWTGDPGGDVNCVAFSPDGSKVASGSWDNLSLWDVSSGNLIWTGDDTNVVISVAFSPDGSKVASSGWSSVSVWNVSSGNLIWWNGGDSKSPAFSPDGSKIAAGDGNSVMLWDTSAGNLIWTNDHTDQVASVAFSPDGSKVASGSNDWTVKAWDTSTGNLIWTGDHADQVRSVVFSPDASILASGGWDNTVKLWDASTGNLIWTRDDRNNTVGSVAFSPDGSKVASGSVTLWEVSSGNRIWWDGTSSGPVAFSPDGSKIAAAGGDGVKVWGVFWSVID
ncbi:MAG: PQQ-binding-like beta-propeller repeat protein [Nitrososphaerales archaeon]